MSDIFQEVDEDVRRDKAAEFWAKYQNFVFAGAALIVLATAAYRYYDYRRVQAAESAGAAFQAALTLEHDGKTADAQAALAKVAGSAPAGYAALSRFAAAAAAARTDAKAGAAAFDALANDSSLDALFREAARLRAALARLDAGDIDAARGALETLAQPNGIYRQTARLTLGAMAIKARDFTGAGKWLDLVVADPQAPQTERAAAETLLGVVASNSAPK